MWPPSWFWNTKFILKIFKTDSSTDRITLLTLILYYIFDEKFLAIWIFAPKWQAVRAMKLKIFGLIFKKHNWLLANYVCNFNQILAWFLMMSNFVWFQKTNSVHIWKLVLYFDEQIKQHCDFERYIFHVKCLHLWFHTIRKPWSWFILFFTGLWSYFFVEITVSERLSCKQSDIFFQILHIFPILCTVAIRLLQAK